MRFGTALRRSTASSGIIWLRMMFMHDYPLPINLAQSNGQTAFGYHFPSIRIRPATMNQSGSKRNVITCGDGDLA
jgi:hypothetical protein